MNLFLKITASLFLASLPLAVQADEDTHPALVAHMVGHSKREKLDRMINGLDKRIAKGSQTGVLTQEKAAELQADVKSLCAKRDKFMALNGAQALTKEQLETLNQMWKEVSDKIRKAKHPSNSY